MCVHTHADAHTKQYIAHNITQTDNKQILILLLTLLYHSLLLISCGGYSVSFDTHAIICYLSYIHTSGKRHQD